MVNQGYVNFGGLKNLWFNTGSRCNLSCTHCYVGSSPTNDSLEQISLDDVKSTFSDKRTVEVEMVYFTGGEPFINKEIMQMLDYCLTKADVTVLSNATLMKHKISELVELQKKHSNKLNFRISLDSYNENEHYSKSKRIIKTRNFNKICTINSRNNRQWQSNCTD